MWLEFDPWRCQKFFWSLAALLINYSLPRKVNYEIRSSSFAQGLVVLRLLDWPGTMLEQGSSTTLVGRRMVRKDAVVSLRSGKSVEKRMFENRGRTRGAFSPPGVSVQKTGGDAAPACKKAGDHTFFMKKDLEKF